MLAVNETERLVRWLGDAIAAEAEGTRLFAIVDGARDEAVVPTIQAPGVRSLCLFDGELHPTLAAAAPYLVELDPKAPLTSKLVARGWGQSWGIYLSSTAPLEALRRHFRGFLRVMDERGRALMFRYYDPRVLRVYLPTCTLGELELMFGPVSTFYMEAPGGSVAMRPVPGPALLESLPGPRIDGGRNLA